MATLPSPGVEEPRPSDAAGRHVAADLRTLLDEDDPCARATGLQGRRDTRNAADDHADVIDAGRRSGGGKGNSARQNRGHDEKNTSLHD